MRPHVVAVVAFVMLTGCTAGGDTGAGMPSPSALVTSPATTRAPSPTPTPAATPTPTPTPTPSPSPSISVGEFDADLAFELTRRLVDEVGERLPGTDGGRGAVAFLEQELSDAGWQVTLDEFALPQGGTSHNVLAHVGPLPAPDQPHLVVGGHWDTVAGTVGANDNASGIGVLLALAAELADEVADLPVPVVLVGFGAEEFQASTGVHHIGSEHLAQARPGVIGALVVDMVGNGPSTRVVHVRDTPDTMSRRLVAAADAIALPDVVAEARGNISDHAPFARRGVPAAFLWTGPDPNLHEPTDTMEHLDTDDLARAGQLTLALVRGLTAADVDGLDAP